MKEDRARSRFDAAHELGHLVMHHDVEPGSRTIENQAHSFAAEFLMPASQIVDHLPRRLDWERFHAAKRFWGTSLKSLVYRAHTLELIGETTYRKANQQLAIWGYPEPGPLGPLEAASLLGKAVSLLAEEGRNLDDIARAGNLTLDQAQRVVAAATDERRRITF